MRELLKTPLRPARLVALVAVVLAIALCGLVLHFRRELDRRTVRQMQQRKVRLQHYGPVFLRDLEVLQKDPVFPPLPAGSPDEDAGPLLNVALPYEDADAPALIAAFRRDKGAAYGRLSLPAEARARIDPWKERWAEHEKDVADLTDKLDFSWMQGLRRAGHWDFTVDSPGARMSPADFWRMPLPGMANLVRWSKLRLLHGLRRGEPAQAAADVRHLARLLHSTEVVLARLIAASLLRLELQVHEAYVNKGHPAPPGWRPVPPDQIERYRRVVWASSALAAMATPPQFREQALPRARGVSEACGGLNEGGVTDLLVRPVLAQRFPVAYERLDRLAARGFPGCRLAAFRKLQAFSLQPDAVRPLAGSFGDLIAVDRDFPRRAWLLGRLYKLGLFRQRIALHALSSSEFDPLKLYVK